MKTLLLAIVIVLAVLALPALLRGPGNKKGRNSEGGTETAEEPPPAKSSFIDKIKSKVTAEKDQKTSSQAASALGSTSVHQLDFSRDFIGRSAELLELYDKYSKQGCVVLGLHGKSGMGKTTLATYLAYKLRTRYPDAQYYIDLRGNTERPLSPEAAMAHVLHSARPAAKTKQGEELKSLYRSTLKSQRAVVFLDNAYGALQVKPLLPPNNCLTLVVSNSPIAMEGMYSKKVAPMSSDESRELVFALAPRAEYWINEIFHLCDGLPLALNVIGSFLGKNSMDPEIFVIQLRVLRDKMKKAQKEGEQIIFDGVLNNVTKLVPPKNLTVFRKLLVFPGSFDAKAQAFACEDDFNDALFSLADYGLVVFDADNNRYHLHEMVREYLKARLNPAETALAETRHATYFLTAVVGIGDFYKSDERNAPEALRQFDLEWENIQAAFRWGENWMGKDPAAARLCSSIVDSASDMLQRRQRPQERIRWLEVALTASRKVQDAETEKNHLLNLGAEYSREGNLDRAIEFSQKALELCKAQNDEETEMSIARQLGFTYSALGDNAKAVEFHQRELDLAKSLGNSRGEIMALGNLGSVHVKSGQTARALELFQRGLELAREWGDRRAEAQNLKSLADLKMESKEFPAAMEFHAQALEIFQKFKDRSAEGSVLSAMGRIRLELRETGPAIGTLEKALNIFRKIAEHGKEAEVLNNLGRAYCNLGKSGRAVELHQKALDYFRKTDKKREQMGVLGYLAQAYAAAVEPDKAFSSYELQISLAKTLGDKTVEGQAGWSLSLALEKFGHGAKAVARGEEALKILSETADPLKAVAEKTLQEWKSLKKPSAS
ncbi:MAG: tetratricopeptide repeat protein [Nitrospinae bacterium]|nr:tetratricopeptide repeat protein [Nitrospinota bacterium]